MCHRATRRLGARRALGYPAADLRSYRQAGELLTPVHGTSPPRHSPRARPLRRRSVRPGCARAGLHARHPKAGALYARRPERALPHGRPVAVPARPAGARASARRGSGRPPPPAGPSRAFRTPGTPPTSPRPRCTAASAGTARTSSCRAAPSSSSWVIRFESVNYRSRVWLNGKPLGLQHRRLPAVRGRLPAAALKRGGTNRLVVRVDIAPHAHGLPARRRQRRRAARSAAGGTTAASCARSTCAASRARTSTAVQVRPVLPCSTCAATMRFRALVRNASPKARPIHVTGAFGGQPVSLGTRTVRGGATAEFTGSLRDREAEALVARPPDPLSGHAHGRRGACTTRSRPGIRSIRVASGHLLLNGRKLNFRGVGLHEDSKQCGFAINNADPRPVHRLGPGSRRDADPQPLPAASLPRGAGRPRSGSCSGRRSPSTRCTPCT